MRGRTMVVHPPLKRPVVGSNPTLATKRHVGRQPTPRGTAGKRVTLRLSKVEYARLAIAAAWNKLTVAAHIRSLIIPKDER